jgi:phosphorylcholine metabolism protein LicD
MSRYLLIFVAIVAVAACAYHSNLQQTIKVWKAVNVSHRLQILEELFNIVMNAAENSQTKPFLTYGTLLGFVRNKTLICYDYDLDFGILKQEYKHLKTEVQSILKHFPQYQMQIKDFLKYGNFEIIHKPTRISADVSAFSFSNTGETFARDVPSLYSKYYMKEKCTTFPIKWILPLQTVDFLNRQTYIPNASSNMLQCFYGTDYLTPDHDCNADCTVCVKKKYM